jgi:hypothetical protein
MNSEAQLYLTDTPLKLVLASYFRTIWIICKDFTLKIQILNVKDNKILSRFHDGSFVSSKMIRILPIPDPQQWISSGLCLRRNKTKIFFLGKRWSIFRINMASSVFQPFQNIPVWNLYRNFYFEKLVTVFCSSSGVLARGPRALSGQRLNWRTSWRSTIGNHFWNSYRPPGKYPPPPPRGGNICRCHLGEKIWKGKEKGGKYKRKWKKGERKRRKGERKWERGSKRVK